MQVDTRVPRQKLKKGSLVLDSVGRENEQITHPGVRFHRNGLNMSNRTIPLLQEQT